MARPYEYRHVVTFGETNLVGNVYYVNYMSWQGRCRETFLREHTPELLEDLSNGMCLFTVHCSCDYLAELWAFDQVIVRMYIEELTQHSLTMRFEYVRENREPPNQLVARGMQRVVCMRRKAGRVIPEPIPQRLRAALESYA